MAYWLVKGDPDDYGWEQLERDGSSKWDGVKNPTAMKHLRAMKAGELVAVYNTGKERRAVGIAEVRAAGDVPVLAARKRLGQPVELGALKEHPLFASSPLVKMGRLSVVPLDDKQWKALLALGKTKL